MKYNVFSTIFYPHEHHPRFDSTVLLSGGRDFSVIVWNIKTAARLHRFCVHGGPILRFLVPPANTSVSSYIPLRSEQLSKLSTRSRSRSASVYARSALITASGC